MGSLRPVFDITMIGSANTVAKDDWYDIGALSTIVGGSGLSPIPVSSQLYIGYMLVGSQDKALTYELRCNNSGVSAGNVANTMVIAYSASDPTSGSVTSDLYQDGNIITLAPVAVSTGVEKLWLRVQSGSNTVAAFEWFIYMTIYN